ncbi:MAG: hypothetical protein QNJ16_07595 [Rhodobacter sp.]|nr:hypothetical protein [Rhodobacter sp.]
MSIARPVGRGAAAQKYDILTAMGTYALAQPKGPQRLVLRFITLITARYNWARDELKVGQREIARLWSCDIRTVKRETAKLRGLGWLRVRRPGARGRVTEYGLVIDAILAATQPHWPAIGPDFPIRMSEQADAKVVPLPVSGPVDPPDTTAGTEWALAQGDLYREDTGLYAAWLKSLRRIERAGGRLVLAAPSRFHAAYVDTHLKARLLAACQAADETVHDVVITS